MTPRLKRLAMILLGIIAATVIVLAIVQAGNPDLGGKAWQPKMEYPR